jgi:serine/threonine-protein kinase RsbW
MQFVRALVREPLNEDRSEVDIEIAVREALANAIIHGNGENPQKLVHVTCRCTMGGEVTLTIRDEGQGFDHRALADPTDATNLFLPHGRGVYLMHALMDEVRFEESGTVVHLRKRLRAPVGAYLKRFVLGAPPRTGTGGAF